MRWRRVDRSPVSDRRGAGMPLRAGGGLGLIVALAVAVVFGTNVFGGGGGAFGGVESPFDTFPGRGEEQFGEGRDVPGAPDPDAELVDFVRFVSADVQNFWQQDFAEAGQDYDPAEVVLFRGRVQSGCGAATAAVGPFYCPTDQAVYLDLSFFRDLADRFGAPGDFAQAYVIAHEFGHHVQLLTGVMGAVNRAESEDPSRANELSVRQELMADCLAGVWGHSTYERGLLETGDYEEGLGAAAAVGDDRLQRKTGGRVLPESFTHGTSEQRTRWFASGFEAGDATACDTFG
jgi:predicted metalloprotease